MLTAAEIHIWHATLDISESRLESLSKTISGDEKQRAQRLYFERDRRHFITSRGILRTILGNYLGIGEGQVQFCYAVNGKPTVQSSPCHRTIHFNLSHSNGEALFAFTLSSQIGIDIEKIRYVLDMDQIAGRFFSLQERELFCSLPRAEKEEAFFCCWTRKEAFIKATGEGLARPMDSFTVPFIPGETSMFLHIHSNSLNPVQWSLHAFKPKPGYVAALVAEGGAKQMIFREWNDY